MANLRDIKKRISSVTSTKQITRTMETVSYTHGIYKKMWFMWIAKWKM